MFPVPIELQDLTVLLAINTIILVLTLEVLSPEYGKVNVYVNTKKLRIATLIVSILFAITVLIRILSATYA